MVVFRLGGRRSVILASYSSPAGRLSLSSPLLTSSLGSPPRNTTSILRYGSCASTSAAACSINSSASCRAAGLRASLNALPAASTAGSPPARATWLVTAASNLVSAALLSTQYLLDLRSFRHRTSLKRPTASREPRDDSGSLYSSIVTPRRNQPHTPLLRSTSHRTLLPSRSKSRWCSRHNASFSPYTITS